MNELRGQHLDRIAFPMGGIGAGMISLEGTGALSQVSLRHSPDVYHEPLMFAALHVDGAPTARVLEGPVPMWKAFGSVTTGGPSAGSWGPYDECGNGLRSRTYGLPRFASASFRSRFPFATVALSDPSIPLSVELTGWSPFSPGVADDSSLPTAAIEYRFFNSSDQSVRAVFSFHAENFMKMDINQLDALHTPGHGASIGTVTDGFVLHQSALPDHPETEGAFAAFVDDSATVVNAAWFRGSWFDPRTMVWRGVAAGECRSAAPHADGEPGAGGSLANPFVVKPGEYKTIRLQFAWYVPQSTLRAKEPAPDSACGPDCKCEDVAPGFYTPWYSSRFSGLGGVVEYWRAHYDRLRAASAAFSDAFLDTSLPAEVVDSVEANLAILKSPTVLRQADGRLWGWEGCHSGGGCCPGSCTHVWNYAQSLPHLFPELERTLRETEFLTNQDNSGHQTFRTVLPIVPPVDHSFHAAADGQLGGLLKLYREWRISGDTDWMRKLWPAAKCSLDYCIDTWDPDRTGTLIEPHHNTYDIEFWGADGMCTSFYLGALSAAVAMGQACGYEMEAYKELLERGRAAMETTLWNGSWYFQQVQWKGLRAGDPVVAVSRSLRGYYSPEAMEILEREGPKYQYGTGCLADGVLGEWIARCAGLDPVLDRRKTAKHVASVFRHNFRKSLSDHANTQRSGYAFGEESGLVFCTWPDDDKPSLPFPYSDETWTGVEYQVASHLAMTGQVDEALEIVRAVRRRHDGRWRNPFDEYECGHWYARAMSSYGLLQGFTGARYDAVERILYVEPAIAGDFRAFLCTARGYGTVGVRQGEPFLTVRYGEIPLERIEYRPVGS